MFAYPYVKLKFMILKNIWDYTQEMKLLEEADQPGNQLDEYISRLNVILSKKAAGIMNLQARLANFQRRLTENNVLVTPLGL